MNKPIFIYEKVIPSEFDKYSLKRFLISNLPDLFPSDNKYKKRLKTKNIWVNGINPTWNYILQKGDVLQISAFNEKRPFIDLKVDIVYEDDQCVVVNKPAGIVVSGNAKRTIENALCNSIQPSNKEDQLPYPLAAHRLDYATSGLLLIAKTSSFLRSAKKAFEERKIKKVYQAIVVGRPDEKVFTINKPIEEKEAITEINVISSVPSIHFGHLTYVEINIETGRKHQIRKHLSENGFPILGDQLYALPKDRLRGKGLFLCSTHISFTLHTQVNVTIDPPNKFDKTLERQKRMHQKKSGNNSTL